MVLNLAQVVVERTDALRLLEEAYNALAGRDGSNAVGAGIHGRDRQVEGLSWLPGTGGRRSAGEQSVRGRERAGGQVIRRSAIDRPCAHRSAIYGFGSLVKQTDNDAPCRMKGYPFRPREDFAALLSRYANFFQKPVFG